MSDKPLYMISVVSEMLTLHPQTIRQYERMGFIKPARTDGNTRRYSNDDIEKLRYITYLTKELGVNTAGVEIIMTLNEEIRKLVKEMESLQQKVSNKNPSGSVIQIKIKKG